MFDRVLYRTLPMLLVACLVLPAAARDLPGIDEPDVDWDVEIYVAADASASGGGDRGAAKDDAWPTISEGLEAARKHLQRGESVKLNIAAGVYRENVDFRVSSGEGKAPQTPLAILGDPDGGTIVRGSSPDGYEPQTWQKVEGYDNVYAHAWDDDRGIEWGPWGEKFGVFFKGVTARSELVFVGDKVLKPVELEVYEWTGLTSKQLREKDDDDGKMKGQADARLAYRGIAEAGLGVLDAPWTFAVADRDESPEHLRDRLFIRLPEGQTPESIDTIEVGSANAQGWEIRGKHHVVMKDITIERFATHYLGQAFKLTGVEHGYFENILIRHNGGKAYGLGDCASMTFINCDILENGGRGFGGTRFSDTLIEGSDIHFNNWRGILGGFTGWDTSAVKITRTNDVLFRACTAVGNAAHGFWTDIYNESVTFERCFAYGNWRRGIFFELSGDDPEDGDDHAIRCVSAYNGEYGVMAMNARRPRIQDCLLINNAQGQIALARSGTRPPHNAAGFERIEVVGNRAISQNGAPVLDVTAYPDHGGNDLVQVLQIDQNRYATSKPNEAFARRSAPALSLDGWQSLLSKREGKNADDRRSRLMRVDGDRADWLDLTDESSDIVREIRSMDVPLPIEALSRVPVPLPTEKSAWNIIWEDYE